MLHRLCSIDKGFQTLGIDFKTVDIYLWSVHCKASILGSHFHSVSKCEWIFVFSISGNTHLEKCRRFFRNTEIKKCSKSVYSNEIDCLRHGCFHQRKRCLVLSILTSWWMIHVIFNGWQSETVSNGCSKNSQNSR